MLSIRAFGRHISYNRKILALVTFSVVLFQYQPVQHAHEEKLRRKSGRSLYLGEHAGAKIIRYFPLFRRTRRRKNYQVLPIGPDMQMFLA